MSEARWRKSGEYFVSVANPHDGPLPAGTYMPYFMSSTAEWYFQPVPMKTDNLFTLPGLPIDYILGQIENFWGKTEEYNFYGFLQKRGIMLYGSPGCGKTSIVNLLRASLVKRDGIVLLLPEDGFSVLGRAIGHLRTVEPNRPIMTLVEDLETYLESSNSNNNAGQEKHALALYDGERQVDNVIHVATTNKPEVIADRFIRRPGRFDVIIGVHNPTEEARREYLRHIINGKMDAAQLEEITLQTDGLSLAYLREIASTYLVLGIPLDETITRLKTQAKAKYTTNRTGFTIGFTEKDQ
jgi:SpoVK/Ycf46/Vps4 family AAA+-type ATPase